MSRTAEFLRSLNFTAEEISTRTGLSPDRVAELAEGASATLAEVSLLSKGLRLSLDTIAAAGKQRERDDVRMLFRRVGSLNEQFDPTREAVSDFVISALDVLPPRDAVPEWMQGLVPEEESFSEAERLAHEVRSQLYGNNLYGPIPDLALVLGREADVIVSRLNQSRFEGASLIIEGYPFIFVSPRFSGRMLFTLAHELGHVVAHHQNGDGAIFERASEIGGWRQRRREAFVDAFASILLMPAHGIGLMLKKVREHLNVQQDAVGDIEILLLARYYGVSFDVAARRCETLELLPSGGARSLTDSLKEEYGSPEKRAEEAKLPPRAPVPLPQVSENLLRAVHHSIESGVRSIGWAADRFGISVNEIFAARKKFAGEHTH